jgi:hypothetical protein
VDNLSGDNAFSELKRKMGVTYQDQITINPTAFTNYEEKVNQIFVLIQSKNPSLFSACPE